MRIKAQDLPPILRENDNSYLLFIEDSINHADPNAELFIRQNLDGLVFSIQPSIAATKQSLIDNLLESHRRLNLNIKFSSSLAIQRKIIFSIKFNEIW